MIAATVPGQTAAPDLDTSHTGFPEVGTPAGKLRFLLSYAVLAPSSHNTQPWRFRIAGDTLELYADGTRALPVVDPDDRELTISCGAALFYLRIALRRFDYWGDIESFPDPAQTDLLARVGLGEQTQPAEEERLLFDAMPLRHTNRHVFEERHVPQALIVALRAAARVEGAWFHVIHGDRRRQAVAELISEGDRIQWADPHFRRELAAWSHPAREHDGLGGYALGIAPRVVRTFDLGKGTAAKDRELATGSPVLAMIETEGDTPADWLVAGQALARVLLRAQAAGVQTSFLNQPIEVPGLRPKLRGLNGGQDFPQLLLRMGYGPEVKPTPRRPLEDVLIS